MNKLFIKGDLFVAEHIKEDPFNGHEYVDLGLPSGLLWATLDVGSDDEQKSGSRFRFGETEPVVSSDSWDNYKWGSLSNLTKYNGEDEKMVLDLEDDAARVNWGGLWRTPTYSEYYELAQKCTWLKLLKENNAVQPKCYKVVGPNGNFIYVPCFRIDSNYYLRRISSTVYYNSFSKIYMLHNQTSQFYHNIDAESRNCVGNVRPVIKINL